MFTLSRHLLANSGYPNRHKSVFGITEFTISASDWRFPVTMVFVCVPFFVIIFVLQTRRGMHAFKKSGRLMSKYFTRSFFSDTPRKHSTGQLQRQNQVGQYHATPRKRPFKRRQSRSGSGHGIVLDPEKEVKSWWPLVSRRRTMMASSDPEIGKQAS